MEQKHIHVGATGLLFESGKLLLGRRADNDDHLPGMWCSPGGGIDFGEKIAEAVEREFYEETGMKVAASSMYKDSQESVRPDEGKHTMLHFRRVFCKPGSADPKPLDGFSDVRWFNMEELAIMVETNQITPMTGWGIIAFMQDIGLRNFLTRK